jgi:membrane-associated phospholipid phosphatase
MKRFFLFFFICVNVSFAQLYSPIKHDFNNFWKTAGDYYTSPLRFDSKDWITFSSVVGLTAISSFADKDIKNFSQRNQSDIANNIFKIDKYYSVEFAGGSILAFYGYGLIAEDKNFRRLALKLTEAIFLSASITTAVKVIAGRGRPYNQESQYYFNSFSFDNDYNSFPSGHTTLAFAYSTVMAHEVDNIFWKVGWYSLAGLVGYARIYHNQHWFSDVAMGAAIGYFTGEFVNNHDTNNPKETSFNFYPLPMGFAMQVRF